MMLDHNGIGVRGKRTGRFMGALVASLLAGGALIGCTSSIEVASEVPAEAMAADRATAALTAEEASADWSRAWYVRCDAHWGTRCGGPYRFQTDADEVARRHNWVAHQGARLAYVTDRKCR